MKRTDIKTMVTGVTRKVAVLPQLSEGSLRRFSFAEMPNLSIRDRKQCYPSAILRFPSTWEIRKNLPVACAP